MYQVTVQERPARPWASLVGAVGALALALGMAAYVTQDKRHLAPVELGAPVRFEHWRATIRIPTSWSHVGFAQKGFETSDVFIERTQRPDPRQIEFRRIFRNVYRPPSYYMDPAQLVRLFHFSAADVQNPMTLEQEPFGPLPGFLVHALSFAALVGVATDGNLYIAEIKSSTGVRRADIAALRACVNTLVFLDRRADGGGQGAVTARSDDGANVGRGAHDSGRFSAPS